MGQPILEVEHLKKSYVNNVPILDDVSFSLQKGEVVVIVGPSGCGKSTFLRCINRLEEIDTGVLKLNGVSYEKEKKNISKVREKIGMVFQSYDLFPNMTILNNLLLAPMKVQKRNKEEVKKEAEQLLDRVGLLDKKDNYPRQLSGGQKQRVAIVRPPPTGASPPGPLTAPAPRPAAFAPLPFALYCTRPLLNRQPISLFS